MSARLSWLRGPNQPSAKPVLGLWLVLPLVAVWCVVGAALMVWPQATVLNNKSSGTDYFIPLNGAWALQGHAAASSPLGVLFYAPYWLVSSLVGMGEPVVRYSQALMFATMSLLSWLTLRGRLRPALVALATVYLSLFATSPVNVGDSPFNIYEACSYNFVAMALGQLAILVAWFPRGRSQLGDGLLVGGLLGWELFVKPNLAVMDLVLIGAGLAMVARRPMFYVGLAVSLVLSVWAVTVAFSVDFTELRGALHQAAAARGGRLFSQARLFWEGGTFWSGVAGLVAECLDRFNHLKILDVLALCATGYFMCVRTLREPTPELKRWCVVIALLVGVDVVRPEFNSVSMTWPFTMLVLCAALSSLPEQRPPRFLGLVTAALMIPLVVGQLAAAANNFRAPGRFPKLARYIPFSPTNQISGSFSNLYVMRGDAGEFAVRMDAGIDLLRRCNLDRKRIGCLDFVNPFPVLLQAPYPAGQPVWLDPGNTFDASNHLSPEVMFGQTDVVMVPTHVATFGTLELLLAIYGPYLGTNYWPVAQNEAWTVLLRNGQPLDF